MPSILATEEPLSCPGPGRHWRLLLRGEGGGGSGLGARAQAGAEDAKSWLLSLVRIGGCGTPLALGKSRSEHGLLQRATGSLRRPELLLPPEALAALHRLNEELPSSRSRCLRQETSEEGLARLWGPGGTWHALGEPPRNLLGRPCLSERPFSRRRPQLRPGAGRAAAAEAFLRHCGLGVLGTKGRKGGLDASLGQDNFGIARLNDGWEFFCVMDGHGPDGHWPATRAVQTCPFFLQSGDCATMVKQGRIDAALFRAFDKVQEDLVYHAWPHNAEKAKVNLMCSGSTAVCALRHPEKNSVWVAHVGDSRAILFAPGRGVIKETQDHKPALDSERKRVEEMGCEVRVMHYEDGIEERVFIRNTDYPGLMMSRSFGDQIVKNKGVIAVPDVVEWSLEDCSGAMLLLASDGVWEFLSSSDVAEMVVSSLSKGESPQEALMRLVEVAKEQWAANEPDYCDDITAVLVPLEASKLCLPAPSPPQCAGGCIAGLRRLFRAAAGGLFRGGA